MIRNTPQPGLHIMVVDDNLVHRRMSQTILTAAGYVVTLADGGPQALASFEKNPPDVVLLDVRMPGMDGFEVCQRLRALPRGKRVPILFLTDVSDLTSPDQAVAVGSDDFLNKPINRIELLMRVRSLLRARHSEAILDCLLGEVREAAIVLDGKGLITKWSREADSVFGWPAGEVVGRPLSGLCLAPERRQSFDDGFAGYLSTGDGAIVNARTESIAVHHSGRRFPILMYVTAIQTATETAFCAFIREAGGPSGTTVG